MISIDLDTDTHVIMSNVKRSDRADMCTASCVTASELRTATSLSVALATRVPDDEASPVGAFRDGNAASVR